MEGYEDTPRDGVDPPPSGVNQQLDQLTEAWRLLQQVRQQERIGSMPRATQSKESQILGWFKTAPVAVATVVLGLAAQVLRDRRPSGPAKAKGKKTATPARLDPPTRPKGSSTPPGLPKAKARKPHRKATPPPAEVDDFNEIGR